MKLNQITQIQRMRLLTRTAFFALFLFAPVLDIFRYDLTLRAFILFGHELSLDVYSVASSNVSPALHVLVRLLMPIMAFIGITGWLIWRYGRIYCGWLCPHFSVVELFNRWMQKQLNRVTLWEHYQPLNKTWLNKLLFAAPAIIMAFIWALALLSYLLPPLALYHDLVTGNLGRGSIIFLTVATTLFSLDFIFTRHLFCKYGCALGLFQSLIWMANQTAMQIQFDRKRAKACRNCSVQQAQKACDAACPMRLPTRNLKRARFACTQCGECIKACAMQPHHQQKSLLAWQQQQIAITDITEQQQKTD